MRIAIVGAGVAGRSLWRFMELDGMLDIHEVEIFDIERPHTRCQIHPCAWGVKTPEWKRVCSMLETKPHILREFTRLNRSGNMSRSTLCTIDKPMFLADICPEDNIQRDALGDVTQEEGYSNLVHHYDLVVDATGVKRAILPSLADDMIHTCRQALFSTHIEDLDISVFPAPNIGYSWVFPLNHPFVHIGQGAVKWDLGITISPEIMEAMEYAGVMGKKPICGWHESKLRTMSPRYCRPITSRNVVGVGEAVGCTSPNNGAGILPGILSAQLLAECIPDTPSDMSTTDPNHWQHRYEDDLIEMFSFLDRETEILKRLLNYKRLGIRDYISLYQNCRYFGMYPGMREVVRIFKMVGARLI